MKLLIKIKILLALTLIGLCLITPMHAGVRSIVINGYVFSIWESGNSILVTGPDGYYASGWRYGNGSVSWTIDRGHCPIEPALEGF